MRSRRSTGIIAGKVRAALPKRASEDGVAVMAVIVDRVAAIDVLPPIAGKEGVLWLDRRTGEAHRKALVQPLHLLQEDDVGIERLQALAQVVDHHAPVEMRQALVDVEGEDLQPIDFHRSPSITIASRLDQEKHFAAASRQGSQAKATCSCGAIATGTRLLSSSANTCSTLWTTPGAKRWRH